MKKGESFLEGRGVKIVMGIMFCMLIVLVGMLFSMNKKLVHFQTSMETRIAGLEKRQDSIEQSLGLLKDIEPGIEGLRKHGEALKKKMKVLQGALEKFIDELSESLSTEQKEEVKKALDKLFRLWEAFGDFMEELEAENRETKGGGQGEGGKG
jgi:uncharacterized coiled-coil protein SlyX